MKWAAWTSIFTLAVGLILTYLLSRAMIIPVAIILFILCIVIWILAYKKRDRLLGEARTKCKKGDHTWFNDEYLKDKAYIIDEVTNKIGDIGNIRKSSFMQTCKFCGHKESAFII